MSKHDVFHAEEEFHSRDKKQHRKDRKIASQKDRSKYKKSDQDQLKKIANAAPDQPKNEALLRGRVLSIIPEGIVVNDSLKDHLCSLKGSMKQDKNRTKNLIAVGDFVRFEDRGNGQG